LPRLHERHDQIAVDFDGARFLHETVGMKRTGAVRVVMVLSMLVKH